MKTNRHSPSLSNACGVLLLGCLLFLAASCTVTTSGSGTGTLRVSWTIASSTDSAQCTTFGAASVVLTLQDSTGAAYSSPTTVQCSSLAATIPAIAVGDYTLTGQAVDTTGAPVGTKTPPVSVSIVANETDAESLDFPASSFTVAPAGTGTLVVDWTIASGTDATACTTYGAANISIQLADSAGAAYGTPHVVGCSAFTTSIPSLPPGTYSLTADMVDASGAAVSNSVGPTQVTITATTTITQPVDFPVSSFTTTSSTAGTLVVDWTIASGTDATACTTYGAANISIQLADSAGAAYGTPHVVGCSAFTISIPSLPPGTYSLTADMVDANGTAVSNAVGPTQVTITAATTTTQPVDFPVSSFITTSSTAGTLVVDWTIALGTDATSCTTYGAVNLSVQLEDGSGNAYGAPHTVPCSAFTTTITNLPAASYSVTAKMVDATGAAVSGQVGPVPITITAATTTTQPMDFPANSFTAPSGTTGTLAITWDIAGGTDAAQCTAHSANTVSIQLYDSSSQPYGSPYTASCSSFATTIANIPPGTYGVGAQMLGATNQAASTAVPPVTVTVTVGATTYQSFDFPANAFYM